MADERKRRRWPASAVLISLLIGLWAIGVVVELLLPPAQSIRSRQRTQAWKNLRQISIALESYWRKKHTLPYDPRGPEYALYIFSEELPASCFDSHPRDKPTPEARWDHEEKKLVGSDFEYINRPDIGRRSGSMIVLAEVPDTSYQSVSLLRCDGMITHCKRPIASSRDLLGNWATSDDFLIKGDELFREWESVPLPEGVVSQSATAESEAARGSIWGTQIVQRRMNPIKIDYEYQRGELVLRTFDSPEGQITDRVTTDGLGRIVAFTREPKNWKTFWPIKRELK